ncbi:hypothetical protein HPP92_022387 [Vanilla planifolia]|uniref:Pentatricopeptide repeat-containing protein n=1 Tax=Vanilla planifolia TaxID=51239 RepID=A0A835PT71_VANPL|nr:hypothetical protein HPP92_022387 [Vanilla planifolia]
MRVAVATLACSQSFFYRNSKTVNNKFQDLFVCYLELKKAASSLDYEIFPPLFKTCASSQLLKEGISVHADAIKLGFVSYTSTANSIMSFYLKTGMLDCALNVFDEMKWRDSVSWNGVIHGFLIQEDAELGLGLFMEARASGFVPNVSTLVLVLKACWKLKTFSEGENLHGYIVKSGILADLLIQNTLLNMYGKTQGSDNAQKLFDEMLERDAISWSSLISAYVQTGEAASGLQLFLQMSKEHGINVDATTVVIVLQACSILGNVNIGRLIHGHVIQRGFEGDSFIGNSLVDMYSKCLDVNSAYLAFTLMARTNLVSWNSLLTGFVRQEKHSEALLLFESMKKAGVESDAYTAVILLQACKGLGQEAFCRSIHSLVLRRQFENGFVLNSLLDAYTKCGLIGIALKLFWQMPSRDLISWSTMISGFSHIGQVSKAVNFYLQMRLAQETPNSVTMLGLLEACSVIADLKLSKSFHGVALGNGLSRDLSFRTALLDTYAKCGDLNSSNKVFEEMEERNILSWNAMVGALGMNGCAVQALATLKLMTLDHVKPNEVTILSLLSACSHGGLIQEGLLLFQRMSKCYSLKPSIEHYSCIVDMLARAGNLSGGLEMIRKMYEDGTQAGPAAWGALLSACRRFGDCELGENVAARILELEPLSSAGYVLSSSMYAKIGLRDETARFRWLMKERGVRVVSGYSLVNVGQHACRFVAWDESHPSSGDIYSMLDLLHVCLRLHVENGYQLHCTQLRSRSLLASTVSTR